MSEWSRGEDRYDSPGGSDQLSARHHRSRSRDSCSFLAPCTIEVDRARSPAQEVEQQHGSIWRDRMDERDQRRHSSSSFSSRSYDDQQPRPEFRRGGVGAGPSLPAHQKPLHRRPSPLGGAPSAPAAIAATGSWPLAGDAIDGQQQQQQQQHQYHHHHQPRHETRPPGAGAACRSEEATPYQHLEDGPNAEPRVPSRRDRASPPTQGPRLSVTLPSSAPPTDPRRRRPRPSPRTGGGSGGTSSAATATPPSASASPPAMSHSPREWAVGSAQRSASPRSADQNGAEVSGVGAKRGALGVDERNPWADVACSTPKGSCLGEQHQAGGSRRVGGEFSGGRDAVDQRATDCRGVKREPRPAHPRFTRHSSAEASGGEQDDRSTSISSLDSSRAQRPRRNDGVDGNGKWEEEPRVAGGFHHPAPLAVSLGEITLGGRREPLPPRGALESGGEARGHVAPALHHKGFPPQQDHNSRWRQSPFPPGRGPPPPRAGINHPGKVAARPPRGLPPRGHRHPRPPPWLDMQHSGDRPFLGEGDELLPQQHQHQHQQQQQQQQQQQHDLHPPMHVTHPPPPNEGGQQRRSAYAQAMRNKRFMGLDAGGFGQPRPRPPMMMPPRGDPCPPFPRHEFRAGPPPFGSGPPRRHWGDGGFGEGGLPGMDGDGDAMGPAVMQAWDCYGGDGEEDEDGFPLVHTSPEWTPGQAGRGGTLKDPSQEDDDGAQDGGAQMNPVSDGSGGGGGGGGIGGGGETRAEFIKRRAERAIGKGGGVTAPAPAAASAAAPIAPAAPATEGRAEGKADGDDSTSLQRSLQQAGEKAVSVAATEVEVQDSATAAVGATSPAAAAAADAASRDVTSSQVPLKRELRLEPAALAKVMWSVGDLVNRFQGLAVPESLTHVIASWAALDTRAIGVIPMLCQPIADDTAAAGEERANGGSRQRNSKGKGKGKGKGKAKGKGKGKGKRKRVEQEAPGEEGGSAAEGCPSRIWEARVIVPFGLIPEKAAKGFWGEALRLVLTPTTSTTAAAGDVAAASGRQADSGNGEDDAEEMVEEEKEEEEEEEEQGEKEKAAAAAAGPVDGRTGDAAVVGGGKLTLPGGRWDEELDGGDPEAEDNRALIGTAVRTCKTAGGVDLAHCSTWLKFCEIHEEDRTTVVFLCGGGVRIAEQQQQQGAPEDLRTATIADVITGRKTVVPPQAAAEGGGGGDDGRGGVDKRCGWEAAFEARLGVEFLWGLVSRDWAGVLLDCLRLQAASLDQQEAAAAAVAKTAAAGPKTALPAEESSSGSSGQRSAAAAAASAAIGAGAQGEPPGDDATKREKALAAAETAMVETMAEARAAFGLFDPEGKGWIAGDRLQACLVDASFRISTRYLKQLLGRVCRVAEDGKRLLFEYSQRLAPTADAADGAGAVEGDRNLVASAPLESQSSP